MTYFKSVKVLFENSNNNYTTSVNPDCTDEEIRQYFVGQYLDVGSYPTENLQKCKDVEIFINTVLLKRVNELYN